MRALGFDGRRFPEVSHRHGQNLEHLSSMMTFQRLVMAGAASATLLVSCITNSGDKKMSAASAIDRLPFQKNQCLSKGGVGIIAKRVFVVVNSERNELILPDGGTWAGRAASERECVFVLRGKLFPADQLPKDFRLEKSVVVSFEEGKVTFFKFDDLSGGFYKRWRR